MSDGPIDDGPRGDGPARDGPMGDGPARDGATGEDDRAPAEVYQGELDGPLFEALIDDLSRFAQIVSVHLKAGPEAHADEAHITLEKARLLLVTGRAHGVRIRYEHEGSEWIDTLLRGTRSIRLVRTRVPIAPSKRKRRLNILG